MLVIPLRSRDLLFLAFLTLPTGFANAEQVRSIRQWAVCGGRVDDAAAVAAAFAAAANGRFTLVVDCPVFIHTGMDVARPIFIDNNTSVVFSGDGQLILDNTLIPAFAIVDTQHVHFRGWKVLYTGELPVDMDTKVYFDAGRAIASDVEDPPGAAFEKRETAWLTARRGVKFAPGGQAPWHGPTNTSAIFFIDGDTGDVTMSGMKFSVPAHADGSRFIPMVFSMTYGIKPDTLIAPGLAITPGAFAVPKGLRFSDINIDGAYMGWQGSAQNMTIEHVRAWRYGDLQDAAGENVGGATEVHGKLSRWFAPPHLIYLNFDESWDPALYNRNIYIHNVLDYGIRVGLPRDNSKNCCSGNALSLKIGAVDSSVTGYESDRPDGLLDVLDSDHLRLSGIIGRYNSNFLDNLYPGIRFPGHSYNDVTLCHVTVLDEAARTSQAPIVMGHAEQHNLVLQDVTVMMNAWWASDAALVQSLAAGRHSKISVSYQIGNRVFIYRATDGSEIEEAKPSVPKIC